MPECLHELITFRGDKLFNGAINIDWFTTNADHAFAASNAFVFHGPNYHGVSQADVGTTHGHRLQDTASFIQSIVRRCYGLEDQPFTLAIAGYGTGKSHLGLTMASLLSDPEGEIAQAVLKSIDAADEGIGRDIRAVLQEAGQPCLVATLNGMKNFDLTTEITQQIIRQVRTRNLDTRPLDELRPRFSQAASLVRMANDTIAEEIVLACDQNNPESVIALLEQQDERIYAKVHDFFGSRGMSITALGSESVRDIIDESVREYCGENKPYRTLLILFDEFGRYTEFATVRSQIAGSGVLQDLFEGIQGNSNQACFAGFIQFELNAYVQRVAPEYKNEILRYVTRYQAANRVYLSINLETLIANLLEKQKPQNLSRWFDHTDAINESEVIAHDLARWFPQVRNHRLWCDTKQFHSVVRKGCWPLSAYSTWFLFHLAAAGKHLQERSAIAMLGNLFERFKDAIVPDNGRWLLSPVDFWSNELQHELITSEESGQQGAITHAYASVDARHGASLQDNLKRLLRAVVIASKMGLSAINWDDAADALSKLAGLTEHESSQGLRLLQEEYNVLEWDEAFKQFDILGDAVPKTQFLSFIRQRVASTFDEAGKAALFASKASTWCDLLSDLDCDFAEENKITTREWTYHGETSNLDTFPMHVKLAADRWQNATAVDEPRGTIIYCYLEPSRDSTTVLTEIKKLLRTTAREIDTTALPILTVMLCDEEGFLGQALAELAVLEESVSDEDRVRFGNLIPAHTEKLRQVVRSQVDAMIKQRLYVTSLKNDLESQRLSKAGTELFGRIYKSPLTFPFDGFSTARGNAADSCLELTTELLVGKLDYDAVMGKPIKVKNRAVSVLKDSWGIFGRDGRVLTRPSHPVLRSLTAKWDELLASGERRLSVEQTLRQLCSPPHGANIASAALMLGVFITPRLEKLVVAHDGQQFAISQWVQNGIFRGKFVDLTGLRGFDLVMLGEESSEWEVLLDEWEQAESYKAQTEWLERALELQRRIPVPPALTYREIHLKELAHTAYLEIDKVEKREHEAFKKLESGFNRDDAGLIAWGAVALQDLCHQMAKEKPLWDEHQIAELQPHIERARQEIIQMFPTWLERQAPGSETLDAVGDFKHRLIRLTGGNLNKLGLDGLFEELQKHVGRIIKNVETVAEAQQLMRDVRSWLMSHSDAYRVVRVAEGDALLSVGKKYVSKLQGMSRRIELSELGEVRLQLSEFLTQLKDAIDQIRKQAMSLWNLKLCSEEDLETYLEKVDTLMNAFENCTNDLEDLRLMRRALRLYHDDYKQLVDERLTWPEFEVLAETLQKNAQEVIDDEDVPWPPSETISSFVTLITRQRKEASAAWIDAIERGAGEVALMSAVDAKRLHDRAEALPPFLTESHTNRLCKVLKNIETRLDELKVDWLIEKYKELSSLLQKKFLQAINSL